jgi:hypothetical protein
LELAACELTKLLHPKLLNLAIIKELKSAERFASLQRPIVGLGLDHEK